ncbi:MAG: hypothetical protein A2428_07170 [Bdellovibrionales bacterium RIFOXYC1_FULL_54_43]|nr:MAG: hypothetical protein A2428_07170 [Bdellovibrionales bacterium RIFOXYC1_FULL_54_43]OFZ79665.1 MAG: hypothetical protein A2603_11585 [Bdellovibrionales bacterium RIFOXYD1_FULL_55_31]
MKLKFFFPVFALLLFAAQSAFTLTHSPFFERWLNPGEELTTATFKRLLDIAKEDPDAYELVQTAAARLNTASPDELITIVKLCPEVQVGEFRTSTSTLSAEPSRNWEQAIEENPELKDKVSRGYETAETRTPTRAILKILTELTICINPDRTLLDSYATLIHELAHYRGYSLFNARQDPLDFKDLEDYLAKVIRMPGGELEAYSTQYRALKRLKAMTRLPYSDSLEIFFTDYGDVVDEDKLSEFILNTLADGLYRKSLTTNFINLVVSDYNSTVRDYNLNVSEYRPLARRNLAIVTRNGDRQKQEYYANYVAALDAEIEAQVVRLEELKSRFGDLIVVNTTSP